MNQIEHLTRQVRDLLSEIECSDFYNRNQLHGLQEENWWLKQLANHNDADCRSFADTENDDDV